MEEIKTYLKKSGQEKDSLREDKELSTYERIVNFLLQEKFGYSLDSITADFVCEDAAVYNIVKEINQLDKHINSIQDKIMTAEKSIAHFLAEREYQENSLEGLKRQKLFSLKELCEYCKNRVEWRDAKDIVAMLKELCWKDGNVDDMELIRSIEKEFKNRTYGNTTIGHQTVIQHVDNYKPQIQEQSVQLGMPPTGQEETKKLKDGKG